MTPALKTAGLAGLVVLALAAGGLYGTRHLWGNASAPGCEASAALLPRLAPLAHGEVAGFQVETSAKPIPALAFARPDGGAVRLADMGGRTVLLNLWATWCEPCKREMPALDRLQATLGGARFEVAAINVDTRNLDRPKLWLAENGIRTLTYYSDRDAKVFQDLRNVGLVEGLPTTILIGPDGCGLGRLSGWAEWASPEGVALMRAAAGG